MPYEYGYELSSCDNCGSSLHQYGEVCSNCGGVYSPPDERELARQAEIGRLFAERQKEAALKRREVKKSNHNFSAFSREFERYTKDIKADIREKMAYFPSRTEKVVQAKFNEINNWRYNKFTKSQKAKVLTLLRQLHAFDTMRYSDDRSLALNFLRNEVRTELQKFTGWKAHFTQSVSSKKVGSHEARKRLPSNRLEHKAAETKNSFPASQPEQKPARSTPEPVQSQGASVEQQPLYLHLEGQRQVVEAAVKTARQWQLAPHYISFFSSKPNATWKARIETATITSSQLQKLLASGWTL